MIRRAYHACACLYLFLYCSAGALAQTQGMVCDVDVDGDIDQLDISAIFAARNTPAAGPGDPRDSIPDGFITINDGAFCVTRCAIAGCPVITPTQNTPPVADAGNDQTVTVGELVTLDGSGSSDADGDMLSYAWSFLNVPLGSSATLSDPGAVMPTFTADIQGEYVIQLVVNDGQADSVPDEVIVVTVPGNSPPVANAGPDQTVLLGTTVQLDGSASTDVDGDTLTFAWTIAHAPQGSTAALSDVTAVNPTFVADLPGDYVVELIVDDGTHGSFPDTVRISTANIPPTADAGPDQTVALADLVQLDGSGSSDSDGDSLTFSWSLASVPTGSTTVLGNPGTRSPTFVADVAGTFVVQLIVNDGLADSAPDTVIVTTSNTRPVANAGADQTVSQGETVQLDGSGSFDADGDSLLFAWSFGSAPGDSSAEFSDPGVMNPTFEADVDGLFVVQLIVNDGELDSDPDTATITVEVVPNTAPDAVDDTATIDEDLAIDIDVLANDADEDGDPLTIDSITQPGNGTALLMGDLVRYTPAADFNGTDSFTYTVSDGTDTATALVTVTVNAVNDTPIAADDNAATEEGVLVDIDVLANDMDIDGDVLTISSVTAPANGTAVALGSSVRYTPVAGFSGTDTFTYTADDGNGGTDSATVTVTVSALPVVTITALDPNAAEAGLDSGTVTIARTGDTTNALSVDLTIGGQATNGTDYQSTGPSFTIPAGQASANLTITPVDDDSDEGEENVLVIIAAAPHYNVGTASSATVTIADDDLPAVTIVATDAAASETGPDAGQFTITRTGDTSDTLTVLLSGAGTATELSDYANIQLSLVLNVGESSRTVTITPVPDNVVEGDETVELSIASSGNYDITAPGSATVTIADDAVTVTIATLDAAADEAGSDPGSFTLTRSGGNLAAALSVSYAAGGTASNGSDYVSIGSSVSIPANQTTAVVTITPAADNLVEGTETVVVSLAADAAYNVGTPASATVNIADDPAVVTIVATDAAASETGPDTGTFTFTRTGGDLAEGLIVTNSISGSAVETGDYQNLQPNFSFAVNSSTHTISVTPIADAVVEGDEAVVLTINESAQYNVGTPGSATVTIADGTVTIDLTPDTLNLLTYASGTMTLATSQPVGSGGRQVDLSVDSGFASVPTSVVLPEGAQQATFTVTAGSAEGTATITASSAGVAAATAVVNVSNRGLAIDLSSPLVGAARTIAGSLALAQPAPAGGVTINLSSGDIGVATVSPTSVTLPEGATTGTFTVTGVALGTTSIEASGAGFDPDSVDVSVTAQVIQIGAVPTVGPEQSASLPITLSKPAIGDVIVTLISADPTIARVTSTVVIPDGQQLPNTNPQVTGVAFGTTSVTASATGFAPETRDVSVALTIAFPAAPDPLPMLVGTTENITMNLSAPAPAGGFDINLTSDDGGIASVPAVVSFPAGQTQVLVPVTAGSLVGTTTIRASAPGVTEAAKNIQVNQLGDVLLNTPAMRVGRELQRNFSVRLETAPPSPTGLTLSVPPGSGVTLTTDPASEGSESITIPNVANDGNNFVWVQGRTLGAETVITASAPGYASGSMLVNVDPSGFAFHASNPTGVDAFAGNQSFGIQALRLDPVTLNWLEQQQVRGGAAFDIPVSSSDPGVGSILNSPVTFGPGQNSALVTFDPVGSGSTVLSLQQPTGFQVLANAGAFARDVQFTVNVSASSVRFSSHSGRVGDELQTFVLVSLQNAPPAPVDLTVSVPTGSGVTLSSDPSLEGGETLTFAAVDDTSFRTVYIQGRTLGATTTMTGSAHGYDDAIKTVNVDPSGFGFIVSDPTSIDAFAPNQSFPIRPLRLDPSTNNWAADQSVRGGLTVDVPVASSDSAVGAIINTPIRFGPNESQQSSIFDPVTPGSTIVSITQPPGFQAPAGSARLAQFTLNVTGSAVIFGAGGLSVGDELQTNVAVRLQGTPPAPVDITLSVPPGSGVSLSADPLLEGSETLIIPSVADTSFRTIYVQGRVVGSTTLTASALGFIDDTLPVEVAPSAFAFRQVSDPTTIDVFAEDRNFSIEAMRLNPVTHDPVTRQSVRGGTTINVPVVSSDPAVGEIINSPVVFGPNICCASARVDPLIVGSSVISIQQPTGFQPPNPGPFHRPQFTLNVTGSAVLFSPTIARVGDELQKSVSVRLEGTPPSPVDLVLSVPSGSGVTLTTDPTLEGSETITFPAVADSFFRTLYVQGRTLGAATLITGQAAGFVDGTLSVNVDPSGFAFRNVVDPTSLEMFASNNFFTIQALRLDPVTNNWAEQQGLRGGASIDVPVLSSDPTVGALITTPVSFTGPQSQRTALIDLRQAGSTELSIQQPPGFQDLSDANNLFRVQFTLNVTGGLPPEGGDNVSRLPGVVATASTDFGPGWGPELAIDGINATNSSWCTALDDLAPRLTLAFPQDVTVQSFAIVTSWSPTYDFLTGRFIMYDDADVQIGDSGTVALSGGETSLLLTTAVNGVRRVDFLGIDWNSREPCLSELAVGGTP